MLVLGHGPGRARGAAGYSGAVMATVSRFASEQARRVFVLSPCDSDACHELPIRRMGS